LHRSQDCLLVRCCVRREGVGEGLLGQPYQPVFVGPEFGGLRVRLASIENIADGLAFVRRQRRDIDQCGYFQVACPGDDGATVRVAGQHDRAIEPLKDPVDGCDVAV
jgi:hypothetical protein